MIITLTYFVISGYFKGIVRQLFSLLTFGGIMIFILYMIDYHNTHHLEPDYDGQKVAMWSAIFFVVFTIVMFFLSHKIKRTLEEASLGPLNKLGGVLVGILKGSIVLFGIVWFVEFFKNEIDFVHEQEMQEMVFYQYINEKRIHLSNEFFTKDEETPIHNSSPNFLDLPQE